MPKQSAKLSAKNVTQLFAGGAALALVSGGGLVFWLNGRINGQQVSQAALQAKVGDNEKVAKHFQSSLDAYNQAKSKLAVLETSVTQNGYVPTLLQQVQNLAGETNLTVNSLHPGTLTAPTAPAAPAAASSDASAKKAAPPSYQTMDIDLSVAGTYADTARFLYGLTRFPKIMSVVSVNMAPGQSGPGATEPQVSTTIHLTAYVFPDTSPDPAAEATPGAASAGTVQTASTIVLPAAAPTFAGAAGRATQGAIAATRAADSRAAAGTRVL